ncbi:MAG TPA: hypothetical protein VNH11_06895 [Pirellulales bacterium]|nr:hypothetical protein [Pirellulales bacterium]
MTDDCPLVCAVHRRDPGLPAAVCRRWILFLLLPLLPLFALGCATHERRLLAIRDGFYSGDLPVAEKSLDDGLKHDHRDSEVLLLERSIVELAEGRPRESEQALRTVRDRFDELERARLGKAAIALITDDRHKAYCGEDYEKVLIRALLSLANLLGDGQDAVAYALQVADKQQQIIEAAGAEASSDGPNPKLAYKQVAIGPYLHGLIREATHGNYDDAARASALVVQWEPQFLDGRADLERARHGRHSAPGNGVLYVFALVGRGPYKEETLELPTTVSLLIADRIISATNKYSLPPTIAPVKVPRIVIPPNEIAGIGVYVDGRPAGTTATITDVGRMAVEQHQAIYPRILAEAVVRRVVKKGIVLGAKEAMGANQATLTSVALDVAGIAWEASEAADTRCWGLLPDKIQVLRLELPTGRHQVALQPVSRYGSTGAAEPQAVTIDDGRNTYLLANFPDSRLVGRIATNSP